MNIKQIMEAELLFREKDCILIKKNKNLVKAAKKKLYQILEKIDDRKRFINKLNCGIRFHFPLSVYKIELFEDEKLNELYVQADEQCVLISNTKK